MPTPAKGPGTAGQSRLSSSHLLAASPVRGPTKSSLLVNRSAEDYKLIPEFSREKHWHLDAVAALRSAVRLLREGQMPAVIPENKLPPGGRKNLLAPVEDLHDGTLVIVTSRLANEYPRVEVLHLGGHETPANHFRRPSWSGFWRAPGVSARRDLPVLGLHCVSGGLPSRSGITTA